MAVSERDHLCNEPSLKVIKFVFICCFLVCLPKLLIMNLSLCAVEEDKMRKIEKSQASENEYIKTSLKEKNIWWCCIFSGVNMEINQTTNQPHNLYYCPSQKMMCNTLIKHSQDYGPRLT